jgi:thioredoxin-dependent peroxiredoxin
VIAVGDEAPDFTLPTDAGAPLTLSALRGAPVVLYFYPQDDTPTCTAQACGMRDAFPRLAGEGATILGVSPDTARSHAHFRRKHRLPFTLLADTDHAVAERYGVWREKTLFGRTYMGVARTTFVIDRDGRVAAVLDVARAARHAAQVESALRGL